MKEFYFFLLLIGTIKIVGSNESSLPTDVVDPSKIVKYHDKARYWTSVDSDGKAYVSLNALKDTATETMKLLFPKDLNFSQILSDITLFFPTIDECKRNEKQLKFKLILSEKDWIEGQMYISGTKKRHVFAKFDETCNRDQYRTFQEIINQTYLPLNGNKCIHDYNPLKLYKSKKRVMELQVFDNFVCKVFMVFPDYAEDLSTLPADIREPLNETFAAQSEEFWWKDSNNESFSDGISFLGRDVVIDITKSTKDIPYFLRIGKNQPYPSLQFKFDANCSNQQYELFVNLRSDDNCKIVINLGEDGINFTTRGTVSTEIYDPTKSLILIFARGESKVYAKAGFQMSFFDICQIENPTDVPDDQFVIQIIPSRGYTVCNTAHVLLPAGDVQNKIEVLLDRVKAEKLIAESSLNGSSNSSTVETTKVANASFEWWWIVIGMLILIVIGIIMADVIYFIRQRKQKQHEMSKTPSKMNNDQKTKSLHPTQKSQTVIPIEESLNKKISPATTPIQQSQD